MNDKQKDIIRKICDDLKRQGKNPRGELMELIIEMQLEDDTDGK